MNQGEGKKEEGRKRRRKGGREGEREVGYKCPEEAHCRTHASDFLTHLGYSLTCHLPTLILSLPTAKKEKGKT